MWPTALAALACAAFARSLWAAPIWDDEYLTVRNPQLASWDGLVKLVSTDIWSSSALQEKSGYYRPVASLTYALNRALGGNTAASYHAGNVLLHASVAVMAFVFVLRRNIARDWIAASAVALFATMPLVAEPVSWIAGRYDLAGAAFALAALLANGYGARRWSVPLAFAAALLSKEPYALVAPLVVLDDLLLLGRRLRTEAVKYVAVVVAAIACFALRHAANVPQPTRLLEQGGVLALVKAYAFAFETLARLAVHPVDLCFFHTYVAPSAFVAFAVLAAVAGAVLVSLLAWRASPDAPHRGVAFGVMLGAAAMAPGALTAPTLHIIGDRYDYFPLVGFSFALAGLLEIVATRARRAWLAPAAVVVLAAAQLPRLESRLGELQSAETMYRTTLARDPHNFTTLLLLGDVLARRGDYAEAERVFLHGRAVAPSAGDIDTGLCFVHLRQRRYADAEVDGRRAVVEKPQNPRAWVNLASALANEDKAQDAVDAATHALEVRPHYAEAHVVRAIALLELRRYDDARADLVAALAIEPHHAQARALLARLSR